jgi:hypothetical protein
MLISVRDLNVVEECLRGLDIDFSLEPDRNMFKLVYNVPSTQDCDDITSEIHKAIILGSITDDSGC